MDDKMEVSDNDISFQLIDRNDDKDIAVFDKETCGVIRYRKGEKEGTEDE